MNGDHTAHILYHILKCDLGVFPEQRIAGGGVCKSLAGLIQRIQLGLDYFGRWANADTCKRGSRNGRMGRASTCELQGLAPGRCASFSKKQALSPSLSFFHSELSGSSVSVMRFWPWNMSCLQHRTPGTARIFSLYFLYASCVRGELRALKKRRGVDLKTNEPKKSAPWSR